MKPHYVLTFSAFHESATGLDIPAATASSGPVFNAENIGDAIARYTNAGATNAAAVELSADEYRAIVLSRLPNLRG
jgi:hypothetical protein